MMSYYLLGLNTVKPHQPVAGQKWSQYLGGFNSVVENNAKLLKGTFK